MKIRNGCYGFSIRPSVRLFWTRWCIKKWKFGSWATNRFSGWTVLRQVFFMAKYWCQHRYNRRVETHHFCINIWFCLSSEIFLKGNVYREWPTRLNILVIWTVDNLQHRPITFISVEHCKQTTTFYSERN